MAWTEEQSKAINERKNNILVSAAAGSGKTAVLVERIIKLVTDTENPVDIDKFLVVTFTKAAALEMKERIVEALLSKLEAECSNEHLEKQLSLLGNAQITTIHSFCLEIIRKNVHIVNLDPDFRVGDEAEISLLAIDTIDKMFEKEYEKDDNESFFKFINTYANGTDDKNVKSMLISLYDKVRQISTKPFDWFNDAIERYNNEEENLDDNEFIKQIKVQVNSQISDILEKYNLILNISQKYGIQEYIFFFNNEMEKFTHLKQALKKRIQLFYSCLLEIEFDRLKSVKIEAEEIKEKIKKDREDVKAYIKNIKEKLFIVSPEKMLQSMKEMYPVLKEMLRLLMLFDESFKKAKNEKKVIDFSDIEHYALKILSKKKTSEQLRGNYTYIFVDEYQDINVIQEGIIKGVCKEKADYSNLFMVGDIKQSIYKFRQAKPEIFLEKYERYGTQSEENNIAINFTQNFRSRDIIINFANYIFMQIMSKGLGGIEYDDRARLNLGAQYPECTEEIAKAVDVDLIIRPSDKESEEVAIEEFTKAELEATHIAGKISKYVGNMSIYDKREGRYRKAEYKDIVILLRSTQNYLEGYAKIFGEQGIPVYSEEDKGYFGSLEIQLMLNILRVINNPVHDIPLVAVLKSPIFKINMNDLLEIRMENKYYSFYESMLHYIETNENELSGRLEEFQNTLSIWRKHSKNATILELLKKIYEDIDIYNLNIISEKESLITANLRLLLHRAEQFDKISNSSIFEFIRFVDKLIENKEDIGSAKVIGENDNVVRIMTIHKSKGLEFPIVFLAGTTKQFNTNMSLREEVLIHEQYGIGVDFANEQFTYKTLNRYIIEQQIKKETISEEIRVLYVALTRPKEKLCIVGVIDDYEKELEKVASIVDTTETSLPESYIAGCRNYLQMLLPCITRKQNSETVDMSLNIIYDIDKSEHNVIILDKEDTKAQENKLINEVKINKRNQEYPEKISVSEIKELDFRHIEEKKHVEKIRELKLESLQATPNFTSAEKGTIIHKLLKHLNYTEITDKSELEQEIQSLQDKGIMTQAERNSIDTQKIYEFCKSNIVQRMKKSKAIHKEEPFVLQKKVSEIYNEHSSDTRTIIVQGVIDCYFEDEDEIVLLDYKTDYTQDETGEYLINKYKSQLQLYKEAIQKATGKCVKEMIIYSIYMGKEIMI